MSALSPILRDAEGNRLHFWCPGCDEVHGIVHGAGGWTWNGDANRPTFQPSILCRYYRASPEGEAMMDRGDPLPPGMDRFPGRDEVCHSFVNDGQIQFLSDCKHKLAGQTVPLPAWTNDEPFPKENTMTLLEGMKAAIAAKNELIAKAQAEIAAIEETIKVHGPALEAEVEGFIAKVEAEAHAGLEKIKAVIASVRAHL